MRATLALLCLFFGSPDDVAADSLDAAQEMKVERYRTFLSSLSVPELDREIMTPSDLPEDLKGIIEEWTRRR
ncbi:hypothetical protein [Microvirga zambiensis]|uniref:hypothetical protein n=1 Tax=Microvirga zambiensis TaxID=1402137 RepID=UPI00191FD3D8|nr:hypothetical protein [Microvirga zambiensis]